MRSYQKFKSFFYLFLVFQNLLFFQVLLGANKSEILKIEDINDNKKELLKTNIYKNTKDNTKELTINFKSIEDILINKNLELKKASKAIDEANLNLNLVKSRYNLKIDLDSTIPEYLSGKNYDPILNLESSQISSSTSLGITIPLYDPVRQPEINSAIEKINIAKDKYEKIKKDLILEASRRFIVFVNAYQETENGNQSVNLSLLNLQDAKARFENGIGT